MSERMPPKLASWLLRHCGSPVHGESLEGDLFEQYQEGRSRAWYWGQVTAVIWIAGGRLLRTLPGHWATRVLSYGLAEVGAGLSLLTIADRARRAHSVADMMSPTFVCTVTVLIALAVVGVLTSIWAKRRRQERAISALLLAFGAVALSAGALTWANAACACQFR